MNRTVAAVLRARRIIDDGDMLLRRALPSQERDALGPFVFLDHYRHRSRRGIGDRPHPHAGIEVLSYLLEGGVEHRDSLGSTDRLGPGDAQHIRAGRGMIHAEQPLGGRHGLQLWTSLPPSQKLVEPSYASVRAGEIPAIAGSGTCVRVIAGCVNGRTGPLLLATPTTLAHIQLESGATVSLAIDEDAEVGVYVLDGLIVGSDGSAMEPGALAVLTRGDRVDITAVPGGRADAVVLGGAPAERPIVFSGPFVMDSEARITEAQRDFMSGRMGTLDGVPF